MQAIFATSSLKPYADRWRTDAHNALARQKFPKREMHGLKA